MASIELDTAVTPTHMLVRDADNPGWATQSVARNWLLPDGSVTHFMLAAGAVRDTNILAGAVTPTKLSNGAVTNPKLNADAVTQSKIANGGVIAGKIDHEQVQFLLSDQDQPVDVALSDRYCILRTGSNWTAPRTITFNGVPRFRGRMTISNNSGQPVTLANGTGSPLDISAPLVLLHDSWVEFAVYSITQKLVRFSRGIENSRNREWLPSVSGALSRFAHSGRGLILSGNVTVPTESGFNALLKATGAQTVTFNGTSSAAMAAGDLMDVEVQSSTVINARLTAAASLVAFA